MEGERAALLGTAGRAVLCSRPHRVALLCPSLLACL